MQQRVVHKENLLSAFLLLKEELDKLVIHTKPIHIDKYKFQRFNTSLQNEIAKISKLHELFENKKLQEALLSEEKIYNEYYNLMADLFEDSIDISSIMKDTEFFSNQDNLHKHLKWNSYEIAKKRLVEFQQHFSSQPPQVVYSSLTRIKVDFPSEDDVKPKMVNDRVIHDTGNAEDPKQSLLVDIGAKRPGLFHLPLSTISEKSAKIKSGRRKSPVKFLKKESQDPTSARTQDSTPSSPRRTLDVFAPKSPRKKSSGSRSISPCLSPLTSGSSSSSVTQETASPEENRNSAPKPSRKSENAFLLDKKNE